MFDGSRKSRKIAHDQNETKLNMEVIRQKNMYVLTHFVSFGLFQTHKFLSSKGFRFQIPVAIWQVFLQTYRQSTELYFKFEAMTILRIIFFKHTSFFPLKDSDFRFLSRFDKFFFKHIGKVLNCISSLKRWRF